MDSETFVDFAISFVEYVIATYPNADEDTIGEVLEVVERVLQQYPLLSSEAEDDEILLALRNLSAVIVADRDERRRSRGTPGVYIAEEQMQYLIDEGFKIKDISLMYMDVAEELLNVL